MQSSSIPTLFPYGAATQAEVINIIRMNGDEFDIQNLTQTLQSWRTASNHYIQTASTENGIAEKIDVKEIDAKYSTKIAEIASDYLFQQTFSYLPINFKLVEIEKIVAPQRLVDLNKVAALTQNLPTNPTEGDLIDFCLSSKHLPPAPKSVPIGHNAFAFSSPSIDFRFLGGYQKKLTPEDTKVCLGGGLPVAAVILFFGYGGSACNVYSVGKRLILNNGFHRLYALLSSGIKYAPVVMQVVSNPDLEFPQQVAGLPKDYLIENQRPVIMKDFVDQQLITTIHKKPTMRNVQIVWQEQSTNVPV